MFRKLSLLVFVASFMGARAADDLSQPSGDAGLFSRMGTAIASAAKSVGNVVVAAFTPSTYTTAAKSAWNGMTWENVKAAPGATFDAMKNNPGKTALVATGLVVTVAGVYAYFNPKAFGLDNEEEKEEDKDLDLEYWPKGKAKSQQ